MKRLVLAFDCDDVLVHTSSVIVARYNRLYRTSVGLDAFYRKGDTWQASSHEEAIQRIDGILREGTINEIGPDEETIRAINLLANDYVTVPDSNYIQRTKGDVCRQIGANVLVDDHVVHGESVLAAGINEVIVFGDYPWNRSVELSKGMVRCLNWFGDHGVIGEIERIASR